MVTSCQPARSTCVIPSATDGCEWRASLAASQCGGDDGSVSYRSSTAAELARERALFEGVLAAAPRGEVADLAERARELELELIVCERTAVVRELGHARRGRGAYAVALGDAHDLLVQVPHSFSDLHTLPLGIELFAGARARVLAISTVHRRGRAGFGMDDVREAPPPRGHADVAHDANSTFQAMTRAWLAAHPSRGVVVQVHGFADHRVDADAVLSSGATDPAPVWLRRVRDRLARLLPHRSIAAFPDDVLELGATTNSQGRDIRAASGRFLHLELSASLRESMRRRPGDRAKFVDELGAALVEAASH